jgi:hypothetical protein
MAQRLLHSAPGEDSMIQLQIKWATVFFMTSLIFSGSAFSKNINQSNRKLTSKVAGRAPASAQMGNTEVDKPLKVQGQSRNLSMMLVRKSEKDKIRFGEILKTHF